MKVTSILALMALFVFGCGKAEAARPPQRSSFHNGTQPYWSCMKGWYYPDEVKTEVNKEAHRKPSDRKQPEDGYPKPEQDPK